MDKKLGKIVPGTILLVAAGTFFVATASNGVAAESTFQETQGGHGWWGTVFGAGMIPLWICSIALVALILERARALKSRHILDDEMVEAVLNCVANGNLEGARKKASESTTVLGRAWEQGLQEYLLGGVSIEEGLTNSTVLHFKPLKRNLQAIQTLGVISPLFGLLGTVVGMIMTFSEIALHGNADKAALAQGIGVALFTTAGGLIVAIPAIVSNRFYIARITSFAEQAEAAINRVSYRHRHVMAEEKEERPA